MMRFITTITISPLVLASFAFLLDYSYRDFMPVENWVHYESVVPVNGDGKPVTSVPIGTSLYFKSTLQRFRDVDHAEYNDILYCIRDEGNLVVRVSEKSTSTQNLKPTQGPASFVWQYQGIAPLRPGVCYLTSYVTIRMKYGIAKTTVIKSKEFTLFRR